MNKIVEFYIDEDVVKEISEVNDAEEAFRMELGWLHDSGIFVENIFDEDEIVIKKEENIKEKREKELLEKVKEEIIKFCVHEYGEEEYDEPFEVIHPSLEYVPMAYTNTPDETHEIQFAYNLVELKGIQYVDGKEIAVHDFNEDGDRIKALEVILSDVRGSSFSDYVFVDEDDLKKALNLCIDDEGNFYKAH